MTTETLGEELKRLVGEYEDPDAGDSTKEEAWNMIADFAVDHADAICSALARRSAASAEPVAWRYRYCRKEYPKGDWSGWLLSTSDPRWAEHDAEVQPLYAAPPSPVASEEMVRRGIEAYEHLIETWPGEDGPGDEVRVRIILTASLSHAPAGEAGWRTMESLPDTEHATYLGFDARAQTFIFYAGEHKGERRFYLDEPDAPPRIPDRRRQVTPSELHNKMAAGFIHSVGVGCKTDAEVMVVLESILLGAMLLNVKLFGVRPETATAMMEEAVHQAIVRFTKQTGGDKP
jgi:hypothetical protein